MDANHISFKDIAIIGFTLFALFFGAGNLVFPPILGQLAGTKIWEANIGFLLTGVGLPLLSVMAFGLSGKPDLLSLSSRVHPLYGFIYTTVLYLSIGPLFAMPRTGSVSYEIAIRPFIPDDTNQVILILFTVLYFGVSCLFSLNPSRIIDIIGKLLTPLLILFLAILAAAAFANPLGSPQAPSGGYETQAFYSGFQEGYLTMDALAGMVFGIIVIEAIRAKGASSKRRILAVCGAAALISAITLSLIYTVLSYLGATSVPLIGYLDNGGKVLTSISQHYFGTFGGVVLGIIVLSACLTTSIGLTTACSTYLNKLTPAVSYRAYAIGLNIFSAVIANFGLSQLISISVPVLKILYPLAIVLVLLTFMHRWFSGRRPVYIGSLLFTFIISLIQNLGETGVSTFGLHEWLKEHLGLYAQGLGWLLPAAAGGLFGLLLTWFGIGRQVQD